MFYMVSEHLPPGHLPPVSWVRVRVRFRVGVRVRVGVPKGEVYDRMYAAGGNCLGEE